MVIGVIGGGASGMMAALHACRGARVILYERQARLGRKLMATGNGRCNLSNRAAASEHYHGGDPGFVGPALARFGVDETLAFFRGLGLVTVQEPDGRIYPFSDQANSVSDVLRLALEQSAVELRLGCEVRELRREKTGFTVRYDGGADRLDRVIVAAGGLAGGKLGGTGAGYDLNNCNGMVIFRMRDAEDMWEKQIYAGNHMTLVYGDYVQELIDVAKVLGIEALVSA